MHFWTFIPTKENLKNFPFIICQWCNEIQLKKDNYCTECGHKLHTDKWD